MSEAWSEDTRPFAPPPGRLAALAALRPALARWWQEIPIGIFFIVMALIGVGLVAALAASPAATGRIGIEDQFHFFNKQLKFAPLAVALIIGLSMLPLTLARRIASLGVLAALALLVAVLFLGDEVKGSSRWLTLAGFQIQPSEFFKPLFAVTAAWLISLDRGRMGAGMAAAGMLGAMGGLLLVMQPDFGQTSLVAATLLAALFFGGLPAWIVASLAAAGIGGLTIGYFTVEHVRERIDLWLFNLGDSNQVGASLKAIANGGFAGAGVGEGQVKHDLPDSHTDFIFAVTTEEYGLVAGLLLIALFVSFTLLALNRAARQSSSFAQIAGGALAVQLFLQAAINIGVNLELLPAKGMTLPFVSAGGSSLLASAVAVGFLLAMLRRPREPAHAFGDSA